MSVLLLLFLLVVTAGVAVHRRKEVTSCVSPISFRVFRWVVVTVLAVFTVVPFYVMVTIVAEAARRRAGRLPLDARRTLTLRPFIDIWSTVPLARYFVNSLIVCVLVDGVSRGRSRSSRRTPCRRYRFRGRGVFTVTVLSTQMFPGILFLLPLFLIFVNIDNALGFTLLYQTRLGLIITYLTFSLPFSIWMLVSYLDSIPRELDEAAKVDGTGAARRAVPGRAARPRARASSRSRSTRS